MKHLKEEGRSASERHGKRRPSIKSGEKCFFEITFSLPIGTISVYFPALEMSPHWIMGPGPGSSVQYFPRDWWCVFPSRVTGYCFPEKQLRMQMTSYGASYSAARERFATLPGLAVVAPWRLPLSLSRRFLCQSFDVIGKASVGRRGKC